MTYFGGIGKAKKRYPRYDCTGCFGPTVLEEMHAWADYKEGVGPDPRLDDDGNLLPRYWLRSMDDEVTIPNPNCDTCYGTGVMGSPK